MAELEEKLNAILGNQEAMGQIMALARSLSGEGRQEPAPEQPPPEPEGEEHTAPVPAGQMPDLSALLGEIDPNMIQMGMRIIRQVQSTEDRNAALLTALRPFLREERRARLDRALQIARMTKLIRVALTTLGSGEGADHV